MTVSVLIPFGGDEDPHRARNRRYVLDHYAKHHPGWEIIEGHCAEPWSKGAAIADARRRCTSPVIVLADADSFTTAETLELAVERCTAGNPWVVPHLMVYRLNERGTDDVLAGGQPGYGRLARAAYGAVPGGGITVLAAAAFDAVRGIDDRFLGWGGEDVSFAIALLTLVAAPHRLDGDLWHLWHPHPAPDLRGSLESEALVADYTAARLQPRLMRALIDRCDPEPWVELEQPVRFVATGADHVVQLSRRGRQIRFDGYVHETRDPDEVDALRLSPEIMEVKR